LTPRIFAVAILCSSTWACAEPLIPDAQWAQNWLDQAYLPRHQQLTQTADALVSASENLCKNTNEQQLALSRTAWLASSQAWRSMDGAPAGPMILERLGRKIDFRPSRPDDIESAIKGGDESNAATRGLAAIEYLLWGDAQPKQQLQRLTSAERCAYLLKLAKKISASTHELDQPWLLYREQLGAENPFFRQNLFPESLSLMQAGIGSMLKRLPANKAKPEQFTEWRSGSSKAQLLAHLAGLQQALYALAAKFRADTKLQLAQNIEDDLKASRQACQALPDKLEHSQPAQRLSCAKTIVQIKNRLQNDIAAQLNISLNADESDGD
jgi:uncharacterized protein